MHDEGIETEEENAGLGWQIFNTEILNRLNETEQFSNSSTVSDLHPPGTKSLVCGAQSTEENFENDSSGSSGSVGLHIFLYPKSLALPLWDASNCTNLL